ncbi:efflux RND transporter periplasmic adaptor subunit [Kiritimatiellota bacterium B12222]|nr:efflux RND transporter periplasmic adaptor subunit [Kiritimatiellota bacterium B12222]
MSASAPEDHVEAQVVKGFDLLTAPVALAQRSLQVAKTPSDFRPLLELILALTGGECVGLLFPGGAGKVFVWSGPDNGFRESLSDELLAEMGAAFPEKRTRVKTLSEPDAHVCVASPVGEAGACLLVAGLILRTKNASEVPRVLAIFQAALGYVLALYIRQRQLAEAEGFSHSAAWVEMSAAAVSAPYLDEASLKLAEDLRKHMQATHSAIVLLNRRDRPHLHAVAGIAHFDPRGRLADLLLACVKECFREKCILQWPSDANKSAGSGSASASPLLELGHQLRAGSIKVIPLSQPGESARSALLMAWAEGVKPSDAVERFLQSIAHPMGLLLDRLEKAEPRGLRRLWHHLWEKASRHRRRAMLCAVVAIILLLCMPVSMPIRVDCTLEPVERRVVSARYDGVLEEAVVRPGDTVAPGALLARLDEQQLNWHEAELRASRERAIRRRDLAMTDPEAPVADAQMAQLEVEGLDLELKLLAHQREHLEIRSPIAGSVLAGDLERAAGVPVKQGQVLFEIGPQHHMIAELWVPSRDVSLVQEGAPVRIRVVAFPGESWNSEVERIYPHSETSHASNVFKVSVPMESIEGIELRAGMDGKAVIDGPRAPLAWVLSRRLVQFVRSVVFW